MSVAGPGSTSVTVLAWAKVNLCLSVGPPVREPPARRGWHPIVSWMHAIDLCDRVVLTPLRDGEPARFERLWAGDPALPVPWPLASDLAHRAFRAVERRVGRTLHVSVRVEKEIPAGGGLGGGSSDAAAVIAGLNALVGLGLGPEEMAALGLALGSDVPFFLDAGSPGRAPRPAIVTGFGNGVERRAPAAAWIVLACPGFGCSTPEVYRRYDEIGARALREEAVRAAASARDWGALFNDLDAAAAAVEPRLAPLRERVERATGARAHLSGSGSCLFAIAGEGAAGERRARDWARRIDGPGVRGIAGRLV